MFTRSRGFLPAMLIASAVCLNAGTLTLITAPDGSTVIPNFAVLGTVGSTISSPASGSGFTEKGICYNTATAPTIANKKVAYVGEIPKATFSVTLTGLAYATKYYARAYAIKADGSAIYGEEFTFTTLPIVPEISTAPVTDITGNSASTGGMVLVPGNGQANYFCRAVAF